MFIPLYKNGNHPHQRCRVFQGFFLQVFKFPVPQFSCLNAPVGPNIYTKPHSNQCQNITIQICVCAVRYLAASGLKHWKYHISNLSYENPRRYTLYVKDNRYFRNS